MRKSIELERVDKSYGGHKVLDQVAFSVSANQIHGFIGPNGAGKTTSMKIICGLTSGDSGAIRILGKDLEQIKNLFEVIGYLPDTPPLYMDLTTKDFLMLVGRLKGLSKAQSSQKVEEYVELLSLQSVYTRLLGNLSKGFKKRVGLAQAVLTMPQVLILDEPLEGLDPLSAHEIKSFLKSYKDHGTVFISSHMLSELQGLCDAVTMINKGKIVLSKEIETKKKSENLEQVFINMLNQENKADFDQGVVR